MKHFVVTRRPFKHPCCWLAVLCVSELIFVSKLLICPVHLTGYVTLLLKQNFVAFILFKEFIVPVLSAQPYMGASILPFPRLKEYCRRWKRTNVGAGGCQDGDGISTKCCFPDMTWLLHLKLIAAVNAYIGLGPFALQHGWRRVLWGPTPPWRVTVVNDF